MMDPEVASWLFFEPFFGQPFFAEVLPALPLLPHLLHPHVIGFQVHSILSSAVFWLMVHSFLLLLTLPRAGA
jgi:hypothetical protein